MTIYPNQHLTLNRAGNPKQVRGPTPEYLKEVSTLGPLQLKIMFAMWRNPEMRTVHAVHAHLNAFPTVSRPLAYTTYLTVMRNLARREFLKQSKGTTRSDVFKPTLTEQEYVTKLLTHINTTVFGGDRTTFAAAVCTL